MDVLVLGAYGMLGHRLLLDLGKKHDVAGTVRTVKEWDAPVMEELYAHKIITGVDASVLSTIRSVIERHRPRYVVNCIGIVKQADAAKDPITSITINSLLPHQLAKMAKNAGGTLIHFSTDCVFSGREGHYSQDHTPDPVDLYGRSKLLGEVSENGITVRSSLIGRELGSRNGLVEWFLSNRRKPVTGFRRAIFSGFTTHEMANVVDLLIEKSSVTNGVWQVASDPITKFDLLSKIDDEAKCDIMIAPNDQEICDRSLNGDLFSQATGYRAPSWDDMIKSMVRDFHLYERNV
ncbi:MAG: dTDP-4-dehydrorhamnose reductase family protein [Methanomassiliicoccales archaeon]